MRGEVNKLRRIAPHPGNATGFLLHRTISNSYDIRASWFETRGVATLLTMRNW